VDRALVCPVDGRAATATSVVGWGRSCGASVDERAADTVEVRRRADRPLSRHRISPARDDLQPDMDLGWVLVETDVAAGPVEVWRLPVDR
ncbi:MAG: hypothetical protein S0880_01845, partial [Actinomycetota bacterium]|nr:hypothetical protein [Actinomycetota bacterium]